MRSKVDDRPMSTSSVKHGHISHPGINRQWAVNGLKRPQDSTEDTGTCSCSNRSEQGTTGAFQSSRGWGKGAKWEGAGNDRPIWPLGKKFC